MAQATRRRGRAIDGQGSVYQDGDGWRAALLLPSGKLVRRRATTEKDAYDKLHEMRTREGIGLPPPSADQLKVFLAWWLKTEEAKAQSGKKSTNTVDNARWAVDKWIIPHLGNKRLRDITPEDVEAIFDAMAAKGLGQSSIIRVRSKFGQALDVALKRGNVVRNVARLAEMPAAKPPKERRSLTEAQAELLLETAKGDRLEALYITGLMMGLRPGELTGLRWSDIDDGIIYLEASLKNERVGGPGSKKTLRLGDTKTTRSRRPLRIPAPVLAALKVHKRRQAEERLAARVEWHDGGYIFTTPIGTPIDPANLRLAFDALTAKAGLGHWTPNELRHSAASLLSARGVPLEVIADVLGHNSTRMLEKHYRHRTRPVIDAHVTVMDGLFGTG